MSAGKPHVLMGIIPPVVLVHVIWAYLFCGYLNLGIVGISIATTISYFLLTIILIVTINGDPELKPCNAPPTLKSFVGFGNYVSTITPSVIAKSATAWSFSAFEFIGCTFSIEASAAMGILNGILPFYKFSAIICMVSVFVLVNYDIGRNDIKNAKILIRNLILENFIITIFIGLLISLNSYSVAALYTHYDEVIVYTAEILKWAMPLCCLMRNTSFFMTVIMINLNKAKET